MEHDKTECQLPAEAPILCINNCGFFKSVATINMCSKCYKDMLMKQERAKLATSTFDGIVNVLSSSNTKDSNFVVGIVDLLVNNVEPKAITTQPSKACRLGQNVETKPREGPNRCNTYKRRVSLTGFKCRCGNLFCPPHWYSDKQDFPFDRTSG